MKRKIPKRTPEEKARSEEIAARLRRRIEERKAEEEAQADRRERS
jgi:hypothetical protein